MTIDAEQLRRLSDEAERRWKEPYEGVNRDELIYVNRQLSHAFPEILDVLESTQRELSAAHSIIADLRRQLAGLGIPTQGETK